MEFEEKRKELVNRLKRQKRIDSKEVEDAFLSVARENFIPENYKKYSYNDTPLEIGNGQTISAPHMVAIMAEALDLKQGQKVLEIGGGSGYHAAIISRIVGPLGHVYTIERIEKLAKTAKENLKKSNISNVTLEIGDGSEGLEKYAPYDRIYVTCAAPDVPEPLINQLKEGGKLLIPVGDTICELELIIKEKDKINKKHLGGCAFVPLLGKYGH
jgi:protein-L-isoaspartate(D-aspartate) O-methyltransferase